MKKRVLRKSILTSLVLLMSMATVLVGTSLAWFNVTVVNEGNIIQSGDLKVEFLAADNVGFSGSRDLSVDPAPIFVFDAAAQPGDSVTRYIKVTNKGSIKLAYEIAFSAKDEGLGEAVQIAVKGVSPDVASEAFVGSNVASKILAGNALVKDAYEVYEITMSYDSTVQPGIYEGKSFSLNILMMAWQDKFDASKPVLVSSLAELEAAAIVAVKGQQIIINKDITAVEADVAFIQLVNLNLGGSKLTLKSLSVTSQDAGYMNFANGTLKVDTYTINTPNAEVNHAATFTVDAGETFITTSKTSYKLFGILNTRDLNILGVSVVRPQAGSMMSVSGTLVAPAASVAPKGAATIVLKGAAGGVVTDATQEANVVTNANIVVAGGVETAIQDAINNATAGSTVYVDKGTYIVPAGVEINKANLSLVALGEVIVKLSESSTKPSPGGLVGIRVLKDLGVVTVQGFTVLGFETGIGQSMGNAAGTAFHVLDNTIYPGYNYGNSYMRNGIQVTGINSIVKGNTIYGAPLTADWAGTGILVANTNNVLVENNFITGNIDNGVAILNWDSSIEVTDITVQNNTIEHAFYSLGVQSNKQANLVSNVTFLNNTIIGDRQVVELLIMNVTASNIKLDSKVYEWGLGTTVAHVAGWSKLEVMTPTINRVHFDFGFVNWKINELETVEISVYKGINYLASATLKDPSKYNEKGVSGGLYDIDITETNSWFVEQISGIVGEQIYTELKLFVIKDGVGYVYSSTDLRS